MTEKSLLTEGHQQTRDDGELDDESVMILSRNWSSGHSLRDATLNPNPIGELAFGDEPIETLDEISSHSAESDAKTLTNSKANRRSEQTEDSSTTSISSSLGLRLSSSASEEVDDKIGDILAVENDSHGDQQTRRFCAVAEHCRSQSAQILEEERRLDDELIGDFQRLLCELAGGLLYLSNRHYFNSDDSDCPFSKECSPRRTDDIVSFNNRMERYFATTDSITSDEWYEALPTAEEIRQMKLLIRTLFSYDTFENLDKDAILSQFPSLAKFVTITVISENYCAVHEKFPSSTGWISQSASKFSRFWGYFVVASARWTKRPQLHHSAAHFQSDGEVCAQAAALFQRTRSKSLVVAGASRFAVRGELTNTCQPKTALADAAHNNETMFHAMNLGVLEAANSQSSLSPNEGGSGEESVFFQWHGMANVSCKQSAVFASAGVDERNGVYHNSSAAVNRVVSTINKLLGRKFAHTPVTDEKCRLKATTNIFGRILNGVLEAEACSRNADNENVPGQFVHIEQKGWIGNDWHTWTVALQSIFPPIAPKFKKA